jgi:predicted RNase H-like HicB family nuclease
VAHCAIHEWRCLLSTGKTVAMAMFDLLAAFDLVEADLLVEKLLIYGAEEATCQRLKSYMTGRIQLVQVGNYKSEERSVLLGLPQGGGLSPLLFVLFTSDMPDACNQAWLVMYADDTNCFVVGDTAEETKRKLEAAAEQIVSYMEENKRSPNASKDEYMLFGRRPGRKHYSEGRAGGGVRVSLLGLTINKTINWEHHLLKVEQPDQTLRGHSWGFWILLPLWIRFGR